jgi:hypothetical protein
MDKGVSGNQVRKYSIFLHKIQDSPDLPRWKTLLFYGEDDINDDK